MARTSRSKTPTAKTGAKTAGRSKASSASTPLSRCLQEGARARVTPLDALELATRKWLKGERLDVGRLAKELGIGRATLFRWVGTREQLYEAVLQQVYGRQRRQLLATTDATGLELLDTVVRRNLTEMSDSVPLRKFMEHDPEFAIRLLAAPGGPSQRHSVELEVALLRRVIKDAKLKPQLDVHTLAHIIVRIGEAFLYAGTIGGSKPDIEQAVAAIRILVSAEKPTGPKRRPSKGTAEKSAKPKRRSSG